MALDLFRFYEENKFKFDDKLAYGVYRNRIVSVIPIGNYVKVTIPFSIQLTREKGQIISSKLKEIKQNNRILQHALTTNVYIELLFYQSADINLEFISVLNKCLDVLDEQSIATCEVCPICGQQLHTNDPFARIRDSVLQGHDHCINQFIASSEKFEQKIEEKKKNATIKTIIISVLCMLLFVLFISSISLIGAYKYFVFLVGLGFVILNKYLLRKFKIAQSKKQVIIIAIFSIITTILSIYLGSSVMLYKGNMIALSLIEILQKYALIFIENYETFGKTIVLDILINVSAIGFMTYSYLKITKQRQANVHRLK